MFPGEGGLFVSGADSHRACIVSKSINITPRLDLSTADLTILKTDFLEIGRVIVASAYMPGEGE